MQSKPNSFIINILQVFVYGFTFKIFNLNLHWLPGYFPKANSKPVRYCELDEPSIVMSLAVNGPLIPYWQESILWRHFNSQLRGNRIKEMHGPFQQTSSPVSVISLLMRWGPLSSKHPECQSAFPAIYNSRPFTSPSLFPRSPRFHEQLQLPAPG